MELFGELEVVLSGNPVTVFADYVNNTAANEYEEGFTLGVGYRRVDEPASSLSDLAIEVK